MTSAIDFSAVHSMAQRRVADAAAELRGAKRTLSKMETAMSNASTTEFGDRKDIADHKARVAKQNSSAADLARRVQESATGSAPEPLKKKGQ